MFFSAKVAAIEIAGDDVRLALIKTGHNRPRVLGCHRQRAEYEVPEQRREALIGAITQVLGKMRGRPVAFVLCVSGAHCIARGLTVPFRGARRVASAVPFALEPHLAFPIEDIVLDHSVVAEVSGETEVLALGMRRDQLEEQLELLREAGVEAEAVMVDAAVLTGFWQGISRQRGKGLHALLHARADSSCLAVTYNRRLAFVRALPCSAQDILEQPEAAAREVKNTLRSFLAKWRGEGEISSITLTGVTPASEEREALSLALGLEVQTEAIRDKLLSKALSEGGPNEFEAAIGAAWGAAGRFAMPNLLRTEGAQAQLGQGMAGHLVVSACLALLVLSGWMLYYRQASAQNKEEAAKLRAEVDGIRLEVEELKTQGLGGDNVNMRAFQTPTVLAILNEIVQKMPQDKAAISKLEIGSPESRREWITIEGTASDSAVLGAMLESLKKTGLFRIDESPVLSTEDGKTKFTIKARRPVEESDSEGEGKAGENNQ